LALTASIFAKKNIIPMKKSQCLFFTRTMFLKMKKAFRSKNEALMTQKSCTIRKNCAAFFIIVTFLMVFRRHFSVSSLLSFSLD